MLWALFDLSVFTMTAVWTSPCLVSLGRKGRERSRGFWDNFERRSITRRILLMTMMMMKSCNALVLAGILSIYLQLSLPLSLHNILERCCRYLCRGRTNTASLQGVGHVCLARQRNRY